MEIARKREAEESRLLQEFHEMIDYNMKEMQQCLVAAGKRRKCDPERMCWMPGEKFLSFYCGR